MWIRLLEKGDFAFIPEALCQFRQHEDQETNKNLKSVVHIDDLFKLFFEYSTKPQLELTYFQELKARYNIAHVVWTFEIDSAYKKEKISQLLGSRGVLIHHLLSFLKFIKKSFSSKKLTTKNEL